MDPEMIEGVEAEEFFENRQKEYVEWIQDYRVHTDEWLDKMNTWIASLDEQSRKSLIALNHDEVFIEKYKNVVKVGYMLVAIGIYEAELENGISPTIFDIKKNNAEVQNYIIELKFLLWHFEFDEDQQTAAKELIVYVLQNKVSYATLNYVVHIASMNKVAVLAGLAFEFLDQKLVKYAFELLLYANGLKSGDEAILCTLADLYLQAGAKERALECLINVEAPSSVTEMMKERCK